MARVSGMSAGNAAVVLNVYDLHDNNAILYPWGLGFYHSGVQIGRDEYTFAGEAGIFSHEAKGAPPPAKFREAISLGTFKGTTRDLETIVQSLRSRFGGGDYHILNNNCNHFAHEFVLRVLGVEIPAWVNRMANMGSFCSCLLPDQQAGTAPVNAPGGGGSGGGESSTSFYSRPGRLSQARTMTSAPVGPSSFTSTAGRKLGSSGGAGGGYEQVSSSDVLMEDRREKLRAAATKRFGSSSPSS